MNVTIVLTLAQVTIHNYKKLIQPAVFPQHLCQRNTKLSFPFVVHYFYGQHLLKHFESSPKLFNTTIWNMHCILFIKLLIRVQPFFVNYYKSFLPFSQHLWFFIQPTIDQRIINNRLRHRWNFLLFCLSKNNTIQK